MKSVTQEEFAKASIDALENHGATERSFDLQDRTIISVERGIKVIAMAVYYRGGPTFYYVNEKETENGDRSCW